MSEIFCSCAAWEELRSNNSKTFVFDKTYGWVLCFIELVEEKGYTQVNRFGIPIYYCPMCGNKLI